MSKAGRCTCFPTADEKGAVLPLDLTFRRSDDKMICVFKGNLLQRYLHCLCYADAELPFPGNVETIDHFGTHTYFGKILGLEAKRQQQSRPAIADADRNPALAAVPADMFRNPQEVEPGNTWKAFHFHMSLSLTATTTMMTRYVLTMTMTMLILCWPIWNVPCNQTLPRMLRLLRETVILMPLPGKHRFECLCAVDMQCVLAAQA